MCVFDWGDRVTWKGMEGWMWEQGPGRGQATKTAVQVQILDPGVRVEARTAKVVHGYLAIRGIGREVIEDF